ncbi:MAG: STAS domain-containing protein [Clostridia bacterium]|nr:STAS domain-containing protein [Clostridia bacterium]MDE7181987.1 STAS domain-containing protein [Clostridia bacterium]
MQQVKLVQAGDKLTFSLSGEIDSATSENFYAQVKAAYLHDKKDVVFDCAALTFIDSTMLGTFVKILKEVKADGNNMRLINVQPRIRKLFEICALDTIMEIER